MKLNFFLLLIILANNLHSSFAQEDIEKFKSKLLNFNLPPSWTIKGDSNKIMFEMTDTMELCGKYDLCPLKYDTLSISTYKLEVTFENNWTKKRLKRTLNRKEELIEYLNARIINYGDSLNWEIAKTNKQSVLGYPMRYLYIVKNWNESEQDMIVQVRHIPNDIIKGVGIFVLANTLGVIPERKNKSIIELYSQLNVLGIHIPGMQSEEEVIEENVEYYEYKFWIL